ncbi:MULTISPECIES: hypothetical protein [Phyllobacteriaceae]|jgi:hypothetical protein|uniref:hypothetical protein n=1 Tax=Phyllobacteriaceae TaxID=69277 RepID=UPI0004B5FD31|nr:MULTISPECIES: hypothetical protein [Mesorhizobium]MBN9236963.1 hypothetical protein [Mesorhizobium sp.]MDQ0328231.1 hypothetical protein [Mesorhizobium sp. YL-MeA3-2017]
MKQQSSFETHARDAGAPLVSKAYDNGKTRNGHFSKEKQYQSIERDFSISGK